MPEKTDKKLVPVSGKIGPQINRYYAKISKRYRALGALVMAVLVLYISFIIMFFGEYITYDNLKYLARDLGSVAEDNGGMFEGIMYSAGEDAEFSLFREGVSVSDTNSYRYYDAEGILLIDEEKNFADPQMVVGGKYLLLYDLGGNGYSIFNKLTCVIDRETDGRLVTGDIAQNGEYILVMRSRETKFVVEYYNASFKKTMSIYKDNYVMEADISENGEYIVICSAIPSETDFDCEIDLCAVGETQSRFTVRLAHTLPLDVQSTEDGFIVLCDNGLYRYDFSGNLKWEKKFSGMTLEYADIGEGRIAVVGSVNAIASENRVLVLDLSGNVLLDAVRSDRINGVYVSPDTENVLCYLKSADTVTRVGAHSEEKYRSNSGEILKVLPTKYGAILCQKTTAFVIFGDLITEP